MLLPDFMIRNNSRDYGMIVPCFEPVDGKGIISYGITGYGYDCCLGTEFKRMDNKKAGLIDPKNFNQDLVEEFESTDPVIIPGHGFLLGTTIETFSIPRAISCTVLGKSTYARCGLVVNATPLEPEWRGKITIELSNTTDNPIAVYPNEGIAQIQFHVGFAVCEVSYADKNGKYQDQAAIVFPIVRV